MILSEREAAAQHGSYLEADDLRALLAEIADAAELMRTVPVVDRDTGSSGEAAMEVLALRGLLARIAAAAGCGADVRGEVRRMRQFMDAASVRPPQGFPRFEDGA